LLIDISTRPIGFYEVACNKKNHYGKPLFTTLHLEKLFHMFWYHELKNLKIIIWWPNIFQRRGKNFPDLFSLSS
jgi:hypothetical protein